jgi:tRNA(Ile)-lysidine synthase TilS/MesJ
MKSTCKKCLLPVNYLNIEIDNEGVCQHCREFTPINYLGTEKLLEDIQPALKMNKSEKYNCVVGFSGGRDSTYLLWYVVKILKLRPLAVFSDDLFIPDIALQNMETTCKILNVELRNIKHDNLKRCINHHLSAWIKRPVPESLMFINVGERIGYETLVEKEAIKEGVHLIFGGRTPIQSSEKYKKKLIQFNNKGGRLSWILGYLKQVTLNPRLIMNFFCLKTQYKEFMVTLWKKRLIRKHNLTIIHPFYKYIRWVEEELEKILFNELKWVIPEGVKNSARFGCEVDTLRQFLYYRTLGYNDTHVDLSYLIRDQQISKQEALDKLESSLDFSEDNIKYILSKAKIDAEAFLKELDKKYPVNVMS